MKEFDCVAHQDTPEKTLWKVAIPDIVPLRMLIEADESAIVGRAALVWDEGTVTAHCRMDEFVMCQEHGKGADYPPIPDPPIVLLGNEGSVPVQKDGTNYLVGGSINEVVVLSAKVAENYGRYL